MSEKTVLSPIELLQELSLAQNLRALGSIAEELAMDVCDAESAILWSYEPVASTLERLADGSVVACSEEHLPGASVLHCETILWTEESLPVPGVSELRQAMACPLKHYGTPVGVLVVVNPGHTDFQPLEELCAFTAIVRGSVRVSEDLAAFTRRTEELLVRAVEATHSSMQGHVSCVAQLVNELSALMDLSAQSRLQIYRAAQFHDVGKLILAGSSATEQERFHSQAGADYLRGTRILRDLAPLVEHHHERFDGSGILGLKGAEVSVEAWALALAEHFEEFKLLHQDWSVTDRLQAFFERNSGKHHPRALDALGGLLVSGRLEQIERRGT